MDKKTKLLSKRVAKIRGWIQAVATLLTNIHISNLFKGKIYQGKIKTVCVPGLNCYSCPAATGACPIGAFQAVIGSSRFKFSYYITGFFILLGVTLGRFICGFLCPFGWFQDLDGNSVDDSLFSGNAVTVVNFWFTGCKPCVAELSALNDLNEALKGAE